MQRARSACKANRPRGSDGCSSAKAFASTYADEYHLLPFNGGRDDGVKSQDLMLSATLDNQDPEARDQAMPR
jgi:hypothetical protein